MKKLNMLKMAVPSAGILTLAIAAGLTYAWFTSTAEPTNLTVNTARINIATGSIREDLALRLPGELAGFDDWTITNNSTRESVLEFSISMEDIEYRLGAEPELSEDRKNELMKLFRDAEVVITGVTAGGETNKVFPDPATGKTYIWLDEKDAADNKGQLDGPFSVKIKIPEELGGNVSFTNEDGEPDRTPNREEEHEAIITLECHVRAVQGTRDAVLDMFGPDVANEFFGAIS